MLIGNLPRLATALHVALCSATLVANLAWGRGSQTPVTGKARKVGPYWAIEIQVDHGKTGWFMISTGLKVSVVTPSLFDHKDLTFDKERHDLSAGSIEWRRVNVSVENLGGMEQSDHISGCLALDVLSKIALAIDKITGDYVLYPGGKVPNDKLREWFRVASDSEIQGIPLEQSATSFFGIKAKLGKESAFFWINSGSDDAYLESHLASRVPSAVALYTQNDDGSSLEERITPLKPLSGLPEWLVFDSWLPERAGKPLPEAWLSFSCFPGDRILVDYPGGSVKFPRSSEDDLIATTIRNLIWVHVKVHGQELTVGDLGENPASDWLRANKCEGAKIVSISGVAAADFIDALRHPERGVEPLGLILAKSSKTIVLKIMTAAGEVTLNINRS